MVGIAHESMVGWASPTEAREVMVGIAHPTRTRTPGPLREWKIVKMGKPGWYFAVVKMVWSRSFVTPDTTDALDTVRWDYTSLGDVWC